MRLVEGRADIDDLDAFLGDIGEVADEFDCAIQAFDADYVLGRDHLRTAVERADRAFDRGENVARERAVEILLYAAGRRQIDRAFAMGVSEGESDVVVVVHSPDGDGECERAAADAVADLLVPVSGDAGASGTGGEDASAGTLAPDRIDRDAVREFFDVTETELDATDAELADLVRERVALLDVEK
ncbi:KEOPS complex subunit Cgi121 [Halorussus sp. MSC15.2]|uniref:KEOPS complex subunit Cgi121 n=1 Tax=Halorussus sp. MSC15.2 TaxID=2283638 RepID=UPI0013D2918F|nr:KEOPS complex subunit Cgi121 [Halorussus sp. MSC15.2]NEU59098.1 KEOPS complex component [Halorussus sp. MSC15.2]